MSLDSETQIALAEELEDIAMELANISLLSPPQNDVTNDQIYQKTHSETERLNDICELYGYNELNIITTWADKNVVSLETDLDGLIERNKAGLFYTWLELLTALLRNYDEELLTELETSLLDPSWVLPIAKQDLQSLLQSLADAPIEVDHNSQNATEELSEDEKKSSTQESSYLLAWDDDIHPELLESFFIETPDQVTQVAELIRNISKGKIEGDTHKSAARIAHTIKGASAVVGIDAVASFAHKLEDILEYSVENKLPEEVTTLLIESADCLESMFDSLVTQSLPPQQYPKLLEKLSYWSDNFTSTHAHEGTPTHADEISTIEPEKEHDKGIDLSWDDDVHPELLEAFFIETPDQVTQVAQLIRNISTGNVDIETHQSAARIAHTIKGSSAVVGLEPVATFSHKLEGILEYSVENQLPKEVSELLIESADCLESIFDSLATQSTAPPQYSQLLEKLSYWEETFASDQVCEEDAEQDQIEETDSTTEKNTESYKLAWNKDVHPELLDAYMGETPEHVIELTELLRRISKGETKKEIYKKASRLSHTIKGTSFVVGITPVADLSNKLEEILEYATEHSLPPALPSLLEESADLLESLYDSLLSEGTPPKEYPDLYAKLCDWDKNLPKQATTQEELQKKLKIEKATPDLSSMAGGSPHAAEDKVRKATKFSIDLPPLQEILPTPTTPMQQPPPATHRANLNEASLRIPISVIEKLLSHSTELITINTQMSDQIQALLAERNTINNRNEQIRNMLNELEWAVNKQTAISSKQLSKHKKHSHLDSLEMDSYNELHSIVGLLSEAIDDDRETSLSLMQQLGDLKGETYKQKRLNKEVNNTILNMRMEPVKILVPRLERIIRETCRQTGKQADFKVIGENITIDTDILKGLVDPLLHLLRNSVDHGIESQEQRKKKSKSSTGNIELSFVQQGDQVVLTLKDDGAGIDADKVYKTAVKKGLVKAKSKLSNNEKLRLILLSGFSTRDKVTEISGRGVGMDVVNTAIKNMSGSITIESKKDQGTEIRIQVPLTLSAANILLVKVLGHTVALPNSTIQQVHYLTQDSIIFDDEKLFIDYNGQAIPLLALSTLLNWSTSDFITNKNQSVLIINHLKKHYALYIDEVLKPQEVTLKTLKPWMTDVVGVNGVCLLPNGVVAPVINIFELLQEIGKNLDISSVKLATDREVNHSSNKILVVDDSLSNRKALSLMLKALDHEVDTAVDGIDALKQIENTKYKLIITDLEMPNMNGLEMVESLRAWHETQNIPIIMITSRSTSKHRQLASQAGVSEYLTKPVDSGTLKRTVDHFFDKSNTKPLVKKAG